MKTEKQSTNMLLIVNITSPNGTYDALYLNNYATINVKDPLGRVNGVGKAEILGSWTTACASGSSRTA